MQVWKSASLHDMNTIFFFFFVQRLIESLSTRIGQNNKRCFVYKTVNNNYGNISELNEQEKAPVCCFVPYPRRLDTAKKVVANKM